MAIIGSAEIIVTPITRGFEGKLRNQLRDIQGTLGGFGRRAGQSLGDAFTQGFQQSASGNIFGQLSDGLKSMVPDAEMAREKFQTLVRVGYVLQAAIGAIVGALSSVIVSLGTLIGVLGRAAPAVAVLANAFVLLRTAMATAKFGFGDIASAVKQATEPSNALGKSIAELNEEFQQLQFQAEEAALSEGRAALNLEKAFENIQRLADLPPNSSARREAQLAYEEAELAYRRAKDRTRDLNEEVAKGPEALNKASANNPYAGLNEAQEEFARKLVGLKPILDELELDISRAFLPPLSEAVDILVDDIYPVLKRQLPTVAKQTGEAIEGIIAGIDPATVESILKGFTEPFEDGGRSNIQLFGDLLNNVLDIFLQIVEATGPLLSDFLTFLVDKTDEWGTKLEETDLVAFFQGAGEYAGGLGEVIGNVFKGLGNLIGLTTGPDSAGQDMLEWMKNATGEFANMFSEDPEAGKQFFRDAFGNAQAVFSSIGALIDEILKLADNPNIGETFKTLEEGAPALGEMLGKMIDAGPSFAEFLKTVTEIANELTDSAQISAFFDTLNTGAETFRDFVQSESFKRLLDNLGPIFASLSAVGILFDVLRFGFKTILGYFIFMSAGGGKLIAGLKGGLENVRNLFVKPLPKGQMGPLTQAQTAQKTMLGKFGKIAKGAGIVGLIITIIAKMVEFYDKFVDFRNMVDTAMSDVKAAFDRFLEPLGELFEKIFGGEDGGGLMGALDPLLKFLLELIIPNLAFALEQVLNILTFVLEMANNLLDWVLPVITDIGEALGALFEGDIYGFFENIAQAFIGWFVGMGQFLVNSVIDLINFMIRSLNNMVGSISNSPFGDFLRDVLGIDLGKMKLGELAKVDWVGDMKRDETARNISSAMAAGAAGGQSFGGPDRLALRSATSNNAQAYTESAIRGMPEYAEYSKNSPTVQVTVNAPQGMNAKEIGVVAGTEIAGAIRRGAYQ